MVFWWANLTHIKSLNKTLNLPLDDFRQQCLGMSKQRFQLMILTYSKTWLSTSWIQNQACQPKRRLRCSSSSLKNCYRSSHLTWSVSARLIQLSKLKKLKKNIFGNKSKGKKTFTRILKQNKPKLDNLAFEVVKLTFFKWTTKFYDEDICILLILALREWERVCACEREWERESESERERERDIE